MIEVLSSVKMFCQTAILLWMLHTELVAYKLFTPLNLSLIEESVSIRCQSSRLREARGPLEEAVLCTSEDECWGLWLPEENAYKSCICEDFPGTNFTPSYKLPFLQIKSITNAPLTRNEYTALNKSSTEMVFRNKFNDNYSSPKCHQVHKSLYLMICNSSGINNAIIGCISDPQYFVTNHDLG